MISCNKNHPKSNKYLAGMYHQVVKVSRRKKEHLASFFAVPFCHDNLWLNMSDTEKGCAFSPFPGSTVLDLARDP